VFIERTLEGIRRKLGSGSEAERERNTSERDNIELTHIIESMTGLKASHDAGRYHMVDGQRHSGEKETE